MPKNYMEVLVDSMLPPLVRSHEHLKDCLRCQEDIRAMALNQLQPLYMVSDKGRIYAKLKEFDHQFQSDIIQALSRAMAVVEDNPHHEEPSF